MTQYNEISKRIRLSILDMVFNAGSGHIDSSFSLVDILVVLYYRFLELDISSAGKGDYFILSKGHAAPALYAILSDKGVIEKKDLSSLRSVGSNLQGHPKRSTPGIDATTGSLGQGLSVACGIAYSNQFIKNRGNKTFALVGDGELNEGQIWEAIMFASHHKISSLTIIVDCNKLQYTGTTASVMNLSPLKEKFEAFGLNVYEIDGHCYDEIILAFDCCVPSDMPCIVLAHTTKGKGVSFMENNLAWHGKVPDRKLYHDARNELIGVM